MKRQIIKINEEKCDGCGICVTACHEGAIGIVDGKAKLLRDDFCDGLGYCLPSCPQGAITFEERIAQAYDQKAVDEHKAKMNNPSTHAGCPGHQARLFVQNNESEEKVEVKEAPSRLMQWPCQIKLVPVNAPYFHNAKLLIAADCSAYAYARMHEEFMKGKITLIGCPKLDEGDYFEKLADILENNEIQSLTVVRMEVPCCGGLEYAAKRALQASGKFIPWQIVTISVDGKILE